MMTGGQQQGRQRGDKPGSRHETRRKISPAENGRKGKGDRSATRASNILPYKFLTSGVCQLVRSLVHDVRFGARMLLRDSGFAVVAVLTLTLGIGATTAIFSVVHAVLLRPPPYKDHERLVM